MIYIIAGFVLGYVIAYACTNPGQVKAFVAKIKSAFADTKTD